MREKETQEEEIGPEPALKKAHIENPVETRDEPMHIWEDLGSPSTTSQVSAMDEDEVSKKRAREECQLDEQDDTDDERPSKKICQYEQQLTITYEPTSYPASTSSTTVIQGPDCPDYTLPYENESVSDVHLRNAILLRTSPRYILFSSLQSLTISITALMSDTSAAEQPINITLSRLRTRCREKSIKEGLVKTLVLKGEVAVTDLTDDVKVDGEHPEWFGSFADIWKGEWNERGVFGGGTKRAVSGISDS